MMGTYLSKPVTNKISTDQEDSKIRFGASCMQGWRETQEDAHNCLPDFDENTSFFAVYDGHGGREVALYCAQKLPQFIKETEAYKNNDLQKALIDGFLGFDATLTPEEVVEVLKQLIDDREIEADVSDDENVNTLYEEASMPLDEVIEKYITKKATAQTLSPFLKGCRHKTLNDGSSKDDKSHMTPDSSSASEHSDATDKAVAGSSSDDNSLWDKHTNDENDSSPKSEKNIPEENKAVSVESNKPDNTEVPSATLTSAENDTDVKANTTNQHTNEAEGTPTTPSSEIAKPQENGKISKTGKGKASSKTKGIVSPQKTSRPKRTAKQLYLDLLESESESEDEEDTTFQGPADESSSEEENHSNIPVDESDESSDSDIIEGEDLDESEEENDDEDDEHDLEFASDRPGISSGCTAVVALMRGSKLYVANAGDSRCIVCRDGTAIDLSVDHKPEDTEEYQRITKAGGRVDFDGRVNGGLNLSRAIGDHEYKQNKDLPDREQMITALPDIQVHSLTPADEFMVLACDGIWNCMSSQEVADFIKSRLDQKPEKLSPICEELFDNCLASNTFGDGTGCDNMTAIIIYFKSSSIKRAAPCDVEESNTPKRAKTDIEKPEQQETSV